MSEENEVIDTVEEISLEDEMKGLLNPTEDAPIADVPVVDTPIVDIPVVVEATPAPTSLSGAIKAKWNELPDDVKAEWAKRETDVHQMMTRHDGDLNLGRKMKDVITPYMPIITAEGGTPEGAVKDLLNTAYVLRTGSPQQKAEIMRAVAQQYGVDLSVASQAQQQTHPVIAQLQQQIQQLQQASNPEVIRNQLQESIEDANIQKQVAAFAADPKNIYFKQVTAAMAPLLSVGVAKDMQEAYDKACWADPTIRSTLLAAQAADAEAKRKADIRAKKTAAASVTGSPGLTSPSSKASHKSLEDELRDQFKEASSVAV